LDLICTQFELALKRGERPRIEEMLVGQAEPERSVLLRELVLLELDYRRAAGEERRADEYLTRFPDLDAGWLAEMGAARACAPAGSREEGPLGDCRLGETHRPHAAPAGSQEEPPRWEAAEDLAGSRPHPESQREVAAIRSFGDYELIREIGRGGMGVVYEARQKSLDRHVAVKLILAGAHAGAGQQARFRTEAQAVARLRHPQIVQIHECGEHEGWPYLVLEYIEGGTLAERLAGRSQPARMAARFVEGLARAVEHAHQHGIVHRDLKPENVLLRDPEGESPTSGSFGRRPPGELGSAAGKIADFGLAKWLGPQTGLTQSTAIIGSPSYMAPEQASGQAKQVGPAADIYALGAILYEMLTGRPPFRAATVLETLEQVKSLEPLSISRLVAGVPRDIETICLKCLLKEQGQRYPSAAALAEDLRRFQAGEAIRARRTSRPERAWRWCRRNPIVASLAGGIALALVVGTAVSTALAIRADREARRARDEKVQSDRRLYLAEIHLAEQAWQEGRTDLVPHHLSQAIASKRPDDPDPRGFEWYYLKRQCELGGILRGHEGMVRGVAFNPDGRFLASAGTDRTIKIWDTVNERLLNTLRGHADGVHGVAYSPDGRRIASASLDHTLKIWDVATGHLLRTLYGHEDWVRHVSYSPDGRTLASAGNDCTVRLWDAATGQPLETLLGHGARVTSVAYSPDGRTLASGSDDRTVKLWEIASRRKLLTLRGHTSHVLGVAYSPDGLTLASAGADLTVKIWDAATGRVVHTLFGHRDWVRDVAYSPDGRTVASASNDRKVLIWDVATGQEVHSLGGHAQFVFGVAYSPDGRRIASASGDGSVRISLADTDRKSRSLRGSALEVFGVAYSPDGRTVASGGFDGNVRIWEVATGGEAHTLRGHTATVTAVAYSPDGRALASASFDHTLKLWDPATGCLLRTLRGHVARVFGVAFGPHGRTVASAGLDGTVKIWDAATGQPVKTLRGHEGQVMSVAYDPDGLTLASGGSDRTVRLWDIASGRERHTLRGHTLEILGVAYSPDGRTLVSGSGDGAVRLWDADTGRELRRLLGHEAWIWRVAFSPDGRRIASAGADQTIRLWDAATGQQVLSLPGHAGAVRSVVFSPDGSSLASVGEDSLIKLWEAAPSSREMQETQEAQSVIQFLFARLLTADQVKERIRHDPTLDDAVRKRAIALAEPYEQSLVARQAERAALARLTAGMFRPEVMASLCDDAALREPVRRRALNLAEHLPENAVLLHLASWSTVCRPGAGVAAYHRALLQAELACRLVPQDVDFLTTLGAAQYRVGNDTGAVATLSLADQIPAASDPGSTEARLAFLALALHRLGKPRDARAALGRLRLMVNQTGWTLAETALPPAREIEALEQDLAFPAEPFAP
jgi:WD40 repeat protein/serine/threonine protein kinase